MDGSDSYFMEKALMLAKEAYELDEVPIGALVVSADNIIVGRGYNVTENQFSQSRHAEVCAIEQAGKTQGDWRMEQCTLYVTLEPCLMCMSLVCLSRISRVVYGASSPLFGYTLDKELLPFHYKKHIKGITAGVRADESKLLLEHFFKHKRKDE
ncbi:nucleoside deaminase [Candidatus Dependentiae bacterium]|nr:nucleoside deaminase [Candidatus Dependentiae bacterium]